MFFKQIKKIAFENIAFIVLSSFYFIFRLVNLTLLPIFNDEAIYLDWGFKSLHFPHHLFYSLFDAKQPFLIWVFGVFEMVFTDPLFAGRVVSVLTGFLTFLGIYFLGKEFFNKKIALVAAFFYVIIPIFSFFDRQALMESAISCISVWSCYLFLQLQQKQTTKLSLLLGVVLGIGFLIKTSSVVFISTVLLLSFFHVFSTPKGREKQLKNIFFFSLVVLVINTILYTQDIFWETLHTNDRYSLTIEELSHFPLSHWLQNMKDVLEISFFYITPIIFLLGCAGIILLLTSPKKRIKLVVSWFLVNLIVIVVFTRNFNPRYIVSFLPLITLFSSCMVYAIWEKQKFIVLLLCVVCSGIAFWLTTLQIFFPLSYFSTFAQVTRFSQKSEYVTDWPSGYGINETREILDKLAQQAPLYVGVRPDSGNPESAIFTYYNSTKRIMPTYINSQLIKPWTLGDSCIRSNLPFYFVARDTQLAGLKTFIVQEIKKIYKPEKKSFIAIYKLHTDITCQNVKIGIKS